MTHSSKSVLITGCSAGGIGSALAVAFHEQGLHVFATARDLSKMAHLRDKSNMTLLSLDVTSSDSIVTAVETVKNNTGGKLEYLVNNCGVGFGKPILDVDLEEARKVYDVNVWGVLAVIQAFAPLVIAAEGTIANTGSVVAHLQSPFIGIYASSKSSLEMISEALRLEMAPFNVKVITIITGKVESNFASNNAFGDLPPTSRYLGIKDYIAAKVVGGKNPPPGMSPENYAQRVVSDILGGATGKVWRGAFASIVRVLSLVLPSFVVDAMAVYDSGLNNLRVKRTE